MKMKRLICCILSAILILPLFNLTAFAGNDSDDAMNMFQNSDFIEKEQPELTEETKQLISLYQRNPTEENYLNLRDIVIDNYNAVLDRKEAKLASLKEETAGKPGGEEKVAEMEEIVQEMYITYWNRINSSMLRFTDSRLLKWKISDAANYDYIPVMGAGDTIYISRTPITNKMYAEYVAATGAAAPSNWTNGTFPENEEDFPVNYISYYDAKAYCDWLTSTDGTNTYRLPNESEWELAAGHMPKDADFNCGVNDQRTSVYEYSDVTRGAHGAIDFWGNVWEWTSTSRNITSSDFSLGVKGGSYKSERTDCRTEYRKESRNANDGYDDVGFRVIKVLNGVEPEQKVELATLDYPVITGSSSSPTSITLSWIPVYNAVEYQIFEYFDDTGLICMLDRTSDTTITYNNLEYNSSHRYIVQPISYTAIADNVSYEYSIPVKCGQTFLIAAPSVIYDNSDTNNETAYDIANAEIEGSSSAYLDSNTDNSSTTIPESTSQTDVKTFDINNLSFWLVVIITIICLSIISVLLTRKKHLPAHIKK